MFIQMGCIFHRRGLNNIEAGYFIENLWYLNQNYFYIFSVSDFLMGEQDMVAESAMSKQHSRVCRFYHYHYYPKYHLYCIF